MKKLLLLASLAFAGLTQVSAQCTISPSCAMGTIGYCTTPAENTALPNGTESSAYVTNIQFSLGTSVGGVFTITDASIASVTGMPAGFAYTTNPPSGVIPANSNACMEITGTPSVGSAGVYTVTVAFNVNTSIGPTSQNLLWYLTIDPNTTGIKSYSQASAVVVSPNPATSELSVSSSSHFGKVMIIDALGKTVINHDADNTLQTSINISSLTKGVYFIQVNNGENVITKKFIKE